MTSWLKDTTDRLGFESPGEQNTGQKAWPWWGEWVGQGPEVEIQGSQAMRMRHSKKTRRVIMTGVRGGGVGAKTKRRPSYMEQALQPRSPTEVPKKGLRPRGQQAC
jgi:hypothetical protein